MSPFTGSVAVFVVGAGVLHSHQEFAGRAFPALDITVGDPKECMDDFTCAGDVQGHVTQGVGSNDYVVYGGAPGAAVKNVKVLCVPLA